MTTRRRDVSIERALQNILVAVLAMPLGACTSIESTPAATSDAGAETTGETSSDASDGAPDPCAPIVLDAAIFDAAADKCPYFTRLPCGLPKEATVTGCTPDPNTCTKACPIDLLFGCSFAPSSCNDGGLVPDADLIVDCVACLNGVGRRPRGLRAPRKTPARSVLGPWFANIAYLEAASVTAFRDLQRSLYAFGAPRSLRRDAARAEADERRHARETRRLARRFGGTLQKPRVRRTASPSLEQLLHENVVEGCVGESFGALVAMWQAERAEDADVARSMRTIAREEAQHAELSWRLFAWGASRLDANARVRLHEKLGHALTQLRDRLGKMVKPEAVVRVAGHPSHEAEIELFSRFERLALQRASVAVSG